MKHRVTCSSCGKKSTVTIGFKGTILSRWAYFGKINLNVSKTSRTIYSKPKMSGEIWRLTAYEKLAENLGITDEWIEKPNPDYDPSAAPRTVEIWECPRCFSEDIIKDRCSSTQSS